MGYNTLRVDIRLSAAAEHAALVRTLEREGVPLEVRPGAENSLSTRMSAAEFAESAVPLGDGDSATPPIDFDEASYDGPARAIDVGDGTNDVPALAAASVGVSIGSRENTVALETADVAVILPELKMAFQGRFDCAVVDDAVEERVRDDTGVFKTPSLIFYRDGALIGSIPKVRDWDDYMARIAHILAVPAAAE